MILQLAWEKEPMPYLQRMSREVEKIQRSVGFQILSKEGISKRRELLAVSNAADKDWKVSTEFSNRVTDLGKNGFSGVVSLGGRITINWGGNLERGSV